MECSKDTLTLSVARMSDEGNAISEDIVWSMLDGLEAVIDGTPEVIIDRLEKMLDGYKRGIKQLEREIGVMKGDISRISEVEAKKELLRDLKFQMGPIKAWIKLEKEMEKDAI